MSHWAMEHARKASSADGLARRWKHLELDAALQVEHARSASENSRLALLFPISKDWTENVCVWVLKAE
jgi:hypothetical protein